VLGVEPEVEALEIAESSADVRHFVHGGGLLQCCTARQEAHHKQQG
jgi:hypothetical protein